MKKKSLITLFDDVLADIHISQEDKDILRGVYFVKVTQKMIELFMALRGTDDTFITDLTTFIDKTTSSLSDQEEAIFSKQLEKEKTQVFIDIMRDFIATTNLNEKEKLQITLRELQSDQTA